MSEAVLSDTQSLMSSLDVLTLEELRKGPQWQSGHSPAEYPLLPDAAGENNLCYVLGWPLRDVSERLVTVAGCQVKHFDEPGFNEVLPKAMYYLWNWGDYHHSWLAAIPKDNLKGSNLTDPAINNLDGDATLFLAISFSKEQEDVNNRVDRRMNKAQFEWHRKVLGQDPSWVLFDRVLYATVKDAVWKHSPCCSRWGKGKPHLVDLGTGQWKHEQE